MNDELSIVNPGVTVLNGHIYVWFDRRKDGLVRHEVFFGKNRQLSIKYGLVIFIRPEDHNGETHGIHCKSGHEFDEYIKAYAQRQAMKYYNWSISDFIEIFGKSYIGE
jgi:hypothetical protein